MSAGYRLCRRCRYDFMSNGPEDQYCDDCAPAKPKPCAPIIMTDTVPMTDAEYEACKARVAAVKHIVFRNH